MLLYMVRNPKGCLTLAGTDLMLPLDGPLHHTLLPDLLPEFPAKFALQQLKHGTAS